MGAARRSSALAGPIDAAASWRVGLAWASAHRNPVTARFVAFVRDALSAG